jgi:hypothetical protein
LSITGGVEREGGANIVRAQVERILRTYLTAGLAFGLAAAQSAWGAEKGQARVTAEKVEYKGWKNNLKIQNGEAELIVTLDVGPRVISYRLADGKNVFKNYDDSMGQAGEAEWMIRGGHRLWLAPEDTTRTYAADNGPVAFREIGSGHVRFTPAPETAYGIQKEIDVKLAPTGSKVSLTHRIQNIGSAPTELAPWALSVMAPGGIEVIPLPPKHPHPGSAKNAKSAADFAPAFVMVLWPFTDLQDPRWHFGSRFLTLRQDTRRGPTKLGLSHRSGAVGYLNAGTLFVKRLEYREGATYPDGGVNYETFSNEDMLEMESLGPLIRLSPGQSVEHLETWELHGGIPDVANEAEIEAKIAVKLR